MTIKPIGRQTNVVVREFETETLIYDLIISKAFYLNQTSALVYQFADGTKTVAEIGALMSARLKTKVSEDFVWFALNELKKENLLENEAGLTDRFTGLSRREAVKKIGLASMVMIPVISALARREAAALRA